MTVLLILTTVSFLLSAWFLSRKQKPKSLESVVVIIHFTALLLFVITVVLLSQNLRFAGQCTNSLIAVAFLVSGIILFGLTTSKIIKVYSGLIAIPALLAEVSLLLGVTPVSFLAVIVFLMFAPPRHKERVNDTYSLEVRQGGLMASPNRFSLLQRKGLFDKEIPLSKSNEYYKDISRLEVISFVEDKHIVCKIYGGNENAFTIDTLQYER
ncbi:MAG TPA: hypothetical protein VGB46_02380 [Flavisolibacter sp.]|jgi:hypothetical protein